MLCAVQHQLDMIAKRQYGLVTRSQLAKLMSSKAFRVRKRRGDLIRVYETVFRLRGAPECWEQSMLAATLATSGITSRRAAGRLWNLPGCEDALVELTVLRPKSVRWDDLTVHSTGTTTQLESRIGGIPVTAPERTIIELSAEVAPRVVAMALDGALERKLVSIGSIGGVLEEMGSVGRGKTRVIKKLLAQRSDTRIEQTRFIHGRTVRRLLEAGITDFEVEFGIRAGEHRRYLDIAWPNRKLAIEVDGFSAHGGRSAFDNDRSRNNDIAVIGWQLLHVTSKTTKRDLLRWVRSALKDVA